MYKKTEHIFLNLYTVFKHLFKKSVTLKYPEEKQKMGKYFRGKLFVENCHGCLTCAKVCPANAISIIKNTENIVVSICFDLEKCIFCGNCAFYCPFNTLQMLKEYELGTDNKQDLKITYKLKG